MEDKNSEDYIKANCPHCDISSQAFRFGLKETKNFNVVCDSHPICEGHILIIPKEHLSCVGEFSEELMEEFTELYQEFSNIIQEIYGKVSSFEHGKIGQTVFHSHVHILPYEGSPLTIVPEGESYLTTLDSVSALPEIYAESGKYLFFSIERNNWLVDTALGEPRFFRDRFAAALGSPEKGNWKEMNKNPEMMAEANAANIRFKEKMNSRP